MTVCLGAAIPEQDEQLNPGVCLDPGAAWAFAQGVEDLGYEYLAVGDHVVGVDITNRPGWDGMYDNHVPWHDALVFLGYLAGATRRVSLFTSVVVLPQRQTAIVAKQAAEVDVLSGGRLWLGVSAGWNEAEYQAVGAEFHNRGRRMDEQIEVLRALWTRPVVTFEGQWHTLREVSLSLMPVQRPIPIWVAGGADSVVRRAARLADGYSPDRAYIGPAFHPTGDHGNLYATHGENLSWLPDYLERLHKYAVEAGRDPASIKLRTHIEVTKGTPDTWRQEAIDWQNLGFTHITASTRRTNLKTVDDHLKALERFKLEVLPVLESEATAKGSA